MRMYAQASYASMTYPFPVPCSIYTAVSMYSVFTTLLTTNQLCLTAQSTCQRDLTVLSYVIEHTPAAVHLSIREVESQTPSNIYVKI